MRFALVERHPRDLVVESGGTRYAETVGGNEGGSVILNRYGRIPLNASGGIANPAAHNIFAMIKNTGCRP